jgi:hypothetical protein
MFLAHKTGLFRLVVWVEPQAQDRQIYKPFNGLESLFARYSNNLQAR